MLTEAASQHQFKPCIPGRLWQFCPLWPAGVAADPQRAVRTGQRLQHHLGRCGHHWAQLQPRVHSCRGSQTSWWVQAPLSRHKVATIVRRAIAPTGVPLQPNRRRSGLSSMWRKPSRTRNRRSSRLKEKLRLPKWWDEVTGSTVFFFNSPSSAVWTTHCVSMCV